ncbi:MAG: hypothetical protein AAB787_00835 [Patescibacteria group bacterium]
MTDKPEKKKEKKEYCPVHREALVGGKCLTCESLKRKTEFGNRIIESEED